MRRFDFPTDIEIGKIRTESSEANAAAKGTLFFPINSILTFSPNVLVEDLPGYLTRFRDGDIAAMKVGHYFSQNALPALSLMPVKTVILSSYQQLKGKNAAAINLFRHLETLQLDQESISPEDLARQPILRKLKSLRLSEFKSTDSILSQLKGSPVLTTLELPDCKCSEDSMPIIASIPNLEFLEVPFVSSQSLSTLGRLQKLRILQLHDFIVDGNSIAALKSLKALTVLEVSDGRQSKAEIKQLCAQLPDVEIIASDGVLHNHQTKEKERQRQSKP